MTYVDWGYCTKDNVRPLALRNEVPAFGLEEDTYIYSEIVNPVKDNVRPLALRTTSGLWP